MFNNQATYRRLLTRIFVVLMLFSSIISVASVSCKERNRAEQTEVPNANNPTETLELEATELVTVTATLKPIITLTVTATPFPTAGVPATPLIPTSTVTVTLIRPDYHVEDTTNYMVYGSRLWHPDNLLATESLEIRTGEYSWSPDGRQLVGWSREFQKVGILTLDTGELTLLENMSLTPGVSIIPQWSPDGNYLLYIVIVKSSDGTETSLKLAIYNLNTKQELILPVPTSLADVIEVSGWSYDSSKIAYVTWEETTTEAEYVSVIETVDITTMETKRLIGPPFLAFVETIWSPTHEQFLIGAITADSQTELSLGASSYTYHEIYLADLEGGKVEQLKSASLRSMEEDTGGLGGYYLSSTPWSNDGQAIIYSDAGLICSLNLLSGEEVCMREIMTDIQQVGAVGAEYPSWSPTGDWISFILKYPSIHCNPIAVIRPDGSDLRFTNVEMGDCTVFNPIWSPRK